MNRIFATLTAFAVIATASIAQANPSGLLLGIQCYESWKGIVVVDTIPGYSADGQLQRKDILKRVTQGPGMPNLSTRTFGNLRYAKEEIGAFQPAMLEVFRPHVGTIYFLIEFKPVGPVVMHSRVDGSAAPVQSPMKMTMRSASPTQGTNWFKAGPQPGPVIQPHPQPTPRPVPRPMPRPTPRPTPGVNWFN